ncbi:MAG: transglycosylase domain-containing protein, partial [Firmicutes bacterium]|nr:transglycosylase domain-containing protein [Bacillota bacterium]
MRTDEKKRSTSAKSKKASAESTSSEPKSSKKKTKKKKKHRVLKAILLIILIIGLIVCGVVGAWVYKIVKNTPSINPDNIYDMLSENSIIFDDDGEVLEYLYDKDEGLRTNLSFNEIPSDLVNAFVAIEDYTFWDHNGFNFIRIIGAIRDSLVSGDPISGTSTITQQLARNLYLEETKDVRSYVRKVQEAYYTIILERELSKEQIVEAYLNTIYLGANSYGISAAAETYFSKDVSELTLAECALLASIPKSPTKYSPIATYNSDANVDFGSMDVVYRDSSYTTVYKDDYRDRMELVLYFMEEQGKITAEQKEQALAEDLRAAINPSRETTTTISSYFADYVTSQVIADLMEEYDLTRDEARQMLNTGGLRIYSTIDTTMQRTAETFFADSANFPTVTNINADKNGNARDKNNNILLYKYSNMFDSDGNFTFKSDEFKKNADGSVTIFRGNRVNVYRTESNGNVDVQLEFKYIYTIENGIFYQINGGVVNIPAKYKTRDDKGNLVISAQFFEDQDWFQIKNDKITFGRDHYTLRQKTIQPQAAMIIFDYHDGGIKAMIGGRSTTGKLLYNRSLSTRQPGSSIKPLAVYSAALQQALDVMEMTEKTAAELRAEGTTIWTPASVIDDSPILNELGELWPKNWYNTYRGLNTLRRSVEQSINVNAVKVQQDIGNDVSIAMLKKLGITSVNESESSVNDKNPSALALGGMVNGISPLQMAAAYGTFANEGVYTEPIAYTKVTNKMGDILLQNTAKTTEAMDEGVAFLMTDMLRTTVSQGICGAANFSGQIVAGKTGTTTDNYDAWFVGMTPYYSASLWIGNDVSLELSTGSTAASRLWSKIMKACHEGLEKGSYPEAPENVIRVTVDSQSGLRPGEYTAQDPRGNTAISEYFLKGTEPTEEETDTSHVMVTICTETGFLATPQCRHTETVLRVQHPEDSMLMYCGYKLADTFCLPTSYSYKADDETWEKWKGVNGAVREFKYPE